MTLQQQQKSYVQPDLFTFADGSSVTAPADWPRRRAELLEILQREEYGFLPPPPEAVEAAPVGSDDEVYAGKGRLEEWTLRFPTPGGEFSFPLLLLRPHGNRRPPVILHLAFRPGMEDRYIPAEELLDRGYACALLCYEDVAPDRDDGFAEGIAPHFPQMHARPDGWGKIAMWAWCAMRAMDYLQTRTDIDTARVTVAGHSRLGKAALLVGAMDERFYCVYANESGAGGDAVTRGKAGERVADLVRAFPYWFCENYARYAGREEEMPFDQHFLLAAIAPRLLCIGAAQEDSWADPRAQYLSCTAADAVWRFLGEPGFSHPNRFPQPGEAFLQGSIGFHLRAGRHFFSRTDWGRLMDFLDYQRRLERGQ
jgi:hypothetical protein